MIGDVITKKNGTPFLDKFGQKIHVGQPVLVFTKSNSSGARSPAKIAYASCYSYNLIIVEDESAALALGNDVNRGIELESALNRNYISWLHHERVASPESVIACSEKFAQGWEDGTVFTI